MPSFLDFRRTVAALIAVAMSAALIAFAFITSDSFKTHFEASARQDLDGASLVVTSGREHLPAQVLDQVRALDGVAAVRGTTWDVLDLDLPPQLMSTASSKAILRSVPVLTDFTTLASGKLPTGAGEAAVNTNLAEAHGLGVGDSLRLKNHEGTTVSVQVVGIVSGNKGEDALYATREQLAAMGTDTNYQNLYVTAKPGADVRALRGQVGDVIRATGSTATVSTAEDTIAQNAVKDTAGGSTTSTLINLLAPVCAVVAIIVITTTFTTLVARQTRVIGLLRCVGASRRQTFRAVLRTAALTGVAGSVAGAALGTGIAAAIIHSGIVEGLRGRDLTITPVALGLSVLLGTLVTLVAVLRPARRATRVSALVALTGQVADSSDPRRRRRRMIRVGFLASLVLVAGIAVTFLGVSGKSIVIAAAGGVLVLIGLLGALPLLVIATAALVERLPGAGKRPILQLAARNLARNSTRSASSAASVLVSVVAGSVLFVGILSFNSAWGAYMNNHAPIDVTVEGVTAETDTAALTSNIQNVDGVESAIAIPNLRVTQESAGSESSEFHVLAVDTKAIAPVVRSTAGLEDLNDDTLVVGGIYDIPDGTKVTLTGPGGSVQVTARVREGWGAVITPATAERLAGGTASDSVMWVRTHGDGSSEAPEKAIRQLVRGQGMMVTGRAAAVNLFTKQLNQVAVVVSAVLGLSLIIALSGLANTTDVAVLERTREIGMLRATGTCRSEIRRLITVEGLLTALLAGVLGCLAGAGLGHAGLLAVLGQDASIAPTIPILPLVGMLVLAAAVGILASLRPAGRASRIPPVQALAQDWSSPRSRLSQHVSIHSPKPVEPARERQRTAESKPPHTRYPKPNHKIPDKVTMVSTRTTRFARSLAQPASKRTKPVEPAHECQRTAESKPPHTR